VRLSRFPTCRRIQNNIECYERLSGTHCMASVSCVPCVRVQRHASHASQHSHMHFVDAIVQKSSQICVTPSSRSVHACIVRHPRAHSTHVFATHAHTARTCSPPTRTQHARMHEMPTRTILTWALSVLAETFAGASEAFAFPHRARALRWEQVEQPPCARRCDAVLCMCLEHARIKTRVYC
jgi:hypothetical protein